MGNHLCDFCLNGFVVILTSGTFYALTVQDPSKFVFRDCWHLELPVSGMQQSCYMLEKNVKLPSIPLDNDMCLLMPYNAMFLVTNPHVFFSICGSEFELQLSFLFFF